MSDMSFSNSHSQVDRSVALTLGVDAGLPFTTLEVAAG